MSIKITQLFKVYWPDNGGGIARVMESIVDGSADCAQEIIVCQASRKKKRADGWYKGAVVHRCRQVFEVMSTPVSLQFLLDVRKRTKDSDIVIYHFPYPMADLAIWLGLCSGKLVVWWHCGVEKHKRLASLYRPLVRHTLKKADRILVSSKGNIVNSNILSAYRKKCRVIPFCVSDEYLRRGQTYAGDIFRQAQQAALFKEKRPVRILFIGRLVWYKGCDILLKAFARMQRTDCRLVLVGGGPLERELKSLAADLKLKNIEFAGIVSEEEKMHQIEVCDFLVLPSISEAEAFAIVQLEAMAFGKPVINTKLKSGVPDVSVDGVTGKTVKPGNIPALTEAMEELAGDAQLRLEYGRNALRIVQEKYTQELMARRHRNVFRELGLTFDEDCI